MTTKLIKNYGGNWTVYNPKTDKMAEIVAIAEYSLLGKSKRRYRVDVSGRTQASMIDSFQEARGIANKLVQ